MKPNRDSPPDVIPDLPGPVDPDEPDLPGDEPDEPPLPDRPDVPPPPMKVGMSHAGEARDDPDERDANRQQPGIDDHGTRDRK